MRRVQQELFGLYLCLLIVLCEISKSQLTTGEGCWGGKSITATDSYRDTMSLKLQDL